MIKVVLLSILIILTFLIFCKKNINEGFQSEAKTIEYKNSRLDNISAILNDDIKIYKVVLKRGTPRLDPETNQPTEMETETLYGLKASDMKEEFPHSIKRDGQVELVSGDSLAAIVFGLCKDNYDNINRMDNDITSLKSKVHVLETQS